MDKKAGEMMKNAREAKGYTQDALAKALGISGRMMQRYEEGHFPKFKNDNILKIDRLLDTNLSEIIYDKKSPPVEKPDDFQAKYIALLEEQNKSNWNESLRILRELQVKLDGLPARLSPGSEKGIVVTGVYPKENKKGRQVP